MIEVLPEAFLLDVLPQIGIGGGENADIGDPAFGGTQGAILPLLQEAQELNLRGRTECVNFIEEQGPAFRFSHEAFFGEGRIRKGPLDMAEQFIFQEVVRQGTTVHGDERLPLSGTVGVDGACYELLAGAGLSQDQDRGIGLRQERNFLDEPQEVFACTYQELKVQRCSRYLYVGRSAFDHLPRQQALQAWEEVDLGERTGDKVIQAIEQRVQDTLWILPAATEKTEDRGLGPVSPEGAERLERLLAGGPEKDEIRCSGSRHGWKHGRGLQTHLPNRHGMLHHLCKPQAVFGWAWRVKIDEQNVKRIHTISHSTDLEIGSSELTHDNVHLESRV